MNTILQQRIEEAAKKQAKKYGCSLYASGNFKDGANFILNNFWISVKEALPEKEGRYLCNYRRTMPNSDGKFDCVDCVDFGLFKDGKWYIGNDEVTHWAPIPTLEGGKE